MTADLTVQTPGDTPQADKLQALADGTVETLLAELPGLDEIELDQLEALERAGKCRTTALGGIIRERDRRDAEGAPPPDSPEPAAAAPASGDYRHLRASQVDPSKISVAVMTLDGWVCPHPAAVAQG